MNKLSIEEIENLEKVLTNKFYFLPIYNRVNEKIELPNLKPVTKNNIYEVLKSAKAFVAYEFSKLYKINSRYSDHFLYFNLQEHKIDIDFIRIAEWHTNCLFDQYEEDIKDYENGICIFPFGMNNPRLSLRFKIERQNDYYLRNNPFFDYAGSCFHYSEEPEDDGWY